MPVFWVFNIQNLKLNSQFEIPNPLNIDYVYYLYLFTQKGVKRPLLKAANQKLLINF